MNIIEIKNLVKYFPIDRGIIFSKITGSVRAVDNVSFAVKTGETLGLVGESGSGKTTVGLLLLRLLTPTAGSITFQGQSVGDLQGKKLALFRQKVQIVFQDPFSSLNPRMTIRDIVGRPLKIHKPVIQDDEIMQRVLRIIEEVGLKGDHLNRYPHQFSGGQRQRIALARSLITNPDLIILDEPTSALDVSVQAQILNLVKDLQKNKGLSYLFISHNLSVIRHISHKVAVMYLGKLVEYGPKKNLFDQPLHPYTKALLRSIPSLDLSGESIEEKVIKGDIPNPANPPPGCRFHTRCPMLQHRCRIEEPEWRKIDNERFVACHLGS
jgi:oligopeptide/dipeptide ABC transporter ATP-binding protein